MATHTHLWDLIERWMDGRLVRTNQSQIAEAVNVSRSAVSQWKSGEARPKPANLRRLAQVTGQPYALFLEAVVRDMGYLDGEEGEGIVIRAASNRHAGESPAARLSPEGGSGHLRVVRDGDNVTDTDQPADDVQAEQDPITFKHTPEGGWSDEVQAELDEHAKAARRGTPALPPDTTTGEESQAPPDDEDPA